MKVKKVLVSAFLLATCLMNVRRNAGMKFRFPI